MFDAGAAVVAAALAWIECWRAAWATDEAETKGCRTAENIWVAEAGEATGCCTAGVTRAAE